MKHILSTLAFYSQYPGWQGFNPKCRSTRRAIVTLEKRGFLEVAWERNQARSRQNCYPQENK